VKLKKLIILSIAASFSLSLTAAAATVTQPAQAGRIARVLAHELPREHLSRHNLDDATAKQMLDNYLSLLDNARIYFMASDIEKFRSRESQLDDEIKDGNIDFAYEVFDILKERVKNRTAYVDELLEKGFDLTIDEEYHWKRKEAPWAANEEEWNELWRKRIKNEYVRIIVSKELAEAEAARIAADTNITHAAVGPRVDPDYTALLIKSISTSPSSVFCAPPASETVTDLNEEKTLLISSDAPFDFISADIAPAIFIAAEKELQEEKIPQENLTPEEKIKEIYVQFQGIIEDSDGKWVLQKYLSAFARAYDPHCDYMSPETSEDFDIDMKLSLCGIGAMLRPEDGAAKIVSLVPGGPADSDTSKNHLRPGDKIIAVGQGDEKLVSILHWPLYKAVRIIRGEKGTKVVLKVIPATDPTGTTTKKVVIIRDEVKLEAREAKAKTKNLKDADGKEYTLGIVDLPAFYADMQGRRFDPDSKSCSRDIAKLLREMREKNVDGIVLDLRTNGGGSLFEAVQMTGLFIKTGPTVQVREARNIGILPDRNPTIAYSGPLVVLVNRLSASASEILAAALQDYGRAVIVGDTKTHGKGSVQTILRLSRDSSMGKFKVTNALFYRISGGSTQLRGVKPDIVVSSAFDFMEFGEDFLPNPMEWSTIKTAIYSPFSDLSGIIPQLTELSEKRRETEESFIAYNKLLKRIEAATAEESFSLNIETRREKAKSEKELLDIQNKLMEQDKEDEDNDIVETEALRILIDLIRITNQNQKDQTIAEHQDSTK